MGEIKIDQLGNNNGLKKSLKSRHVTMISLGGTIGTGLFLASWCDCTGRSWRGITCICTDRCYGVFLNDIIRGNGCLYANIRFV